MVMKFQVDFHYPITFVPFRLRTTEYRYGLGSVELEVAELSDEDAPVAMRIAGGESGKAFRYSRKEDGSLRDIRFRDARFYVETMNAAELVSAMADPASFGKSTFFKMATPIQETFLPGASKVDHYYRKGTELTTIERIRSMQGYGRPLQEDKTVVGLEKMEADLKFLASEMFIIEGRVFELCPEPVVSIVSTLGKPVSCKVVSRPSSAIGSMELDYNLTSGITERAGAYDSEVKVASLRDAAKLLEAYPDAQMPDFELLMPDVAIFDGATNDVMNSTAKLLDNLSRKVAQMDREHLDAFFELRDANAAAARGMMQVTPRLVAALRDFATLDKQEPSEEDAAFARAYPAIGKKSFEGRHHLYKENGLLSRRQTVSMADSMASAAAVVTRWEARNPDSYRDELLQWNGGAVAQGLRTFNVYSEDAVSALARKSGGDREALLQHFRAGDLVIGITADNDFSGIHAFAVIDDGNRYEVTDLRGLGESVGADLMDLVELHVVERPIISGEWQPSLSASF